ncbi:MAG: rod shape-determining protein MreC [Candidatus Binatia bacterium]
MFAFLRRNQVLLTSLLCILFSFMILTAAARGHLRRDPIGPLLLGLMRPFQIGIRVTVIRLKMIGQNFVLMKNLASENEALRRHIIDLEAERDHLLEAEVTNRRLRRLLEFRSHLPSTPLTASVIANSASTWSQSFILDRGRKDGVLKGMAVVSPVGAVGQVVSVTSRNAKVLLITDSYSGVDVIVQRSRARGIVSGSLDNGVIMKYMKRSEDIQKGDRLITSGLGEVFPKGILVGTVTRVRKKSFGLFQDVEVTPAVNPSQIEEVFVVSAKSDPKRN